MGGYKMAKAILFLFMGFIAPFLIACATNPSPTASLAPTSPIVPSAIEYTRIGGIGGFNDHLTIDAKGHAVVSRRLGKLESDLDDAALKKLYAAFQTAGFASLPEDSMPRGVPADAFNYTLTYQGHTVKTADSAVPKVMEPLLEMLNQYVNAAR
jgi:hypothetical protein